MYIGCFENGLEKIVGKFGSLFLSISLLVWAVIHMSSTGSSAGNPDPDGIGHEEAKAEAANHLASKATYYSWTKIHNCLQTVLRHFYKSWNQKEKKRMKNIKNRNFQGKDRKKQEYGPPKKRGKHRKDRNAWKPAWCNPFWQLFAQPQQWSSEENGQVLA